MRLCQLFSFIRYSSIPRCSFGPENRQAAVRLAAKIFNAGPIVCVHSRGQGAFLFISKMLKFTLLCRLGCLRTAYADRHACELLPTSLSAFSSSAKGSSAAIRMGTIQGMMGPGIMPRAMALHLTMKALIVVGYIFSMRGHASWGMYPCSIMSVKHPVMMTYLAPSYHCTSFSVRMFCWKRQWQTSSVVGWLGGIWCWKPLGVLGGR